MGKLILLYWGCIVLMYLSQRCYPEGDLQNKRRGGNFMLDRPDIFLCIIIGWMSAFSFLRTWYNDTYNYIIGFVKAESLQQFLNEGGLTDWAGNPLYNLFRTALREVTDNYHIYFMPAAILSSVGAVKLFKRFSVDPMFSLLVFFSVGTYVMYIAAMKQGIAISILLFSLPYAIDKKYIRYYLCVAIAMLFHTHAVIFAVLPLLFARPWGKATWIFCLAVLVAMVTYNYTFGILFNIMIDLGVNVAEFELFDGHSIHPLRVAVYAIPAVLSLAFRTRLYRDSTRVENLFANMSITTVFVMMIGLVQGANLFARLAAYYEIALGISLPWMIEKLFERKSVRLLKILAYILFFGYFLYEFAISKGFGDGYRAITLWEFIKSLF